LFGTTPDLDPQPGGAARPVLSARENDFKKVVEQAHGFRLLTIKSFSRAQFQLF
jgi:hypothetical protein